MTDAPAVEVKPVYSTGQSVGAIMKANEQVAANPTPTPTPEPIVTPTPAADAAAPVVPIPDTPTPETPKEPNVSNVSLVDFDEPEVSEIPTPATPPVTESNWQEAIKKVNQDEVLKAVGISDFAIEMDNHIKAGGDPIDYLNARAIDYNKIGDEDLVKNELRKKYSGFDIDELFLAKYKDIDLTDPADPDKKRAELQLRLDAFDLRQAKIAEQQKYKVPTPVQQNQNGQEQAQQIAAEEKKKWDETVKWYAENESTKTLMTSKRVAIDLGDDGNFNYAIDKPEVIMKGVLDNETWRRMTSVNPKEPDATKLIPDVAKLQRLVLVASNPNYEKDLVNYGKSLSLPKLVSEGQNLTPPAKVIPVQNPNVSEKELWKNAKSSTIGGR